MNFQKSVFALMLICLCVGCATAKPKLKQETVSPQWALENITLNEIEDVTFLGTSPACNSKEEACSEAKVDAGKQYNMYVGIMARKYIFKAAEMLGEDGPTVHDRLFPTFNGTFQNPYVEEKEPNVFKAYIQLSVEREQARASVGLCLNALCVKQDSPVYKKILEKAIELFHNDP